MLDKDKDASEFYRRNRPKRFRDVVGQKKAISMIVGMKDDYPHCTLLTGPSGTGKTTIARITAMNLGCDKLDYLEINASESRGIDTIRDIKNGLALAPRGKCKVYVFDECHMWTSLVQNSLLKILEEAASYVYFFLCTTDPHKLLNTIKTRCTEFKLKNLQTADMKKVINRVLEVEKISISSDVMDKIIEVSEGSPRKALVHLQQVANLEEKDQLEAINDVDLKAEMIELCRIMLKGKSGSWMDAMRIIKTIDNKEAEGFRHLVLSYCTTILAGSSKKMWPTAYRIMDCFMEPNFNNGRAQIVTSCWEAMFGE
jgi:DNA polymerase III gamma/tau subunit